MVMQSAAKIHPRPLSESCRRLDMSDACDKQPPANGELHKVEGFDLSFFKWISFPFLFVIKDEIWIRQEISNAV